MAKKRTVEGERRETYRGRPLARLSESIGHLHLDACCPVGDCQAGVCKRRFFLDVAQVNAQERRFSLGKDRHVRAGTEDAGERLPAVRPTEANGDQWPELDER